MRKALFGALVLLLSAVRAETAERAAVDLELMLALDVSHSVTVDEHRTQITGLADAFRHPRLISAIRNLPTGRAAVAVMFWAGTENQLLAVPWMLIDGEPASLRFADVIARQTEPPWKGLSFTAPGDALLKAADAIDANAFDGRRRIIDISGDDPANQGISPGEARDQVVLRGIVVNGLPILQDRHEHEERAELVRYFEANLVGGPGAFVLPTLDFADFPRAMLAKLITEVSGLSPATNVACGTIDDARSACCGRPTVAPSAAFRLSRARVDPD